MSSNRIQTVRDRRRAKGVREVNIWAPEDMKPSLHALSAKFLAMVGEGEKMGEEFDEPSPTPNQLQMAEDVARRRKIELPGSARRSRSACSLFIAAYL